MDILFKREQNAGHMGRVTFKLWSKLEFDEAEAALIKRYRFDEAIMIEALQPTLIRNAGLLGLVAGLFAMVLLDTFLPASVAMLFGLLAFGGTAYWHYHNKRETIFVRDLIHGRNFACKTVIDLAKKEAWLTSIAAMLRQVMESAKHWDGTETIHIEALPKEEARQFILKAA